MSTLPKIIESTRKVRFQDCDPFNHLNNGRYLDYFINAREDQLIENYNIDLFEVVKKEGLGWVVANNHVAYILPVSTMETICIESQAINYSEKHLDVEMRMWDKNKKYIKSLAWFRFVPFNLQKNSATSHPERYMELFKEVFLEVPHKTFEEREFYFRKRNREHSSK